MKKLSKRQTANLKIISATGVCIFTLVTAFTSTFAWFSTNKSASPNSGSFSIAKIGSAVDSITIHDFYGSTEDGGEFGFNPSANHTITLDDYDGSGTGEFTMGTYSLNDVHHPVMFLFAVNGSPERIVLKADSTYLAKAAPTYTESVNSFSSLGTYEEGTMVRVVQDETRHNCQSIYKYTNSKFEIQWIDLLQTNNPLSSVISTYYFLFKDDPRDNQGENATKTGSLYLSDGFGGKTGQTRTYMPIASNSLTENNRSSFVSFNSQGEPSFNNNVDLFYGNTAGYSYLGIIIDYNVESLEYLYSFFLGHAYLNNGLGFICDWSMEV